MTVRGELDLRIPALVRLKELQDASDKADKALVKLGKTMDRVGGPKSRAQLRAYRDEVKGLGTQSVKTATEVSKSFDKMSASIDKNVAKSIVAVKALKVELEELGHTNVTATIDVNRKGTIADIKAVRKEVAGLAKDMEKAERATTRLRQAESSGDREASRVSSRIGRGGGGSSGGLPPRTRPSGGGSGGRRFGRGLASGGGQIPLGVTSVTPRTFLALLPAAAQLGGAFVALAGSAASAAAGLGAIGIAAGGAATAGIGGLAAIAVPALGRVSAASKARAALVAAKQPGFANSQQQIANTQAMQAAEQGLTQAQRQAKVAQDDLTQSRRDAIRQLTDMRLAARGAALAERGASIQLGEAKLRLQQTRENPLATTFDRRQAQLDYDSAKLGSTQARVDARRATVDARRTRRRGVSGNRNVQAAVGAVQDSKYALSNARFGLKQATQELVRGSSQIAQAKSDLNRAFAAAPQGTKRLLSDVQKLKTAFGAGDKGAAGATPTVKAAQTSFLRFLDGGVKTMLKMRNSVAGAGLSSANALNRNAPILESFLAGPQTARWIRDSSQSFAENIGNIFKTLRNLLEVVQNISMAARPFLKQGTGWLASVTGGWAKGTRDLVKTRGEIRKMVSDLRDWKNLLSATGKLLRDVFSAGRGPGSGMVRDLTTWLDKQDRFIQRNPAKVREFFKNAVDSTQKMATAAWSIAKALGTLAETLRPLLNRASELVTTLGPLMQFAGLPGGLALAGAGYSALKGRKGRAGSGGLGAGLVSLAAGGRSRTSGALRDRRYFRTGGIGPAREGLGSVAGRGASGLAGGAASVISRRVLPIMAAFAALDYTSFKGSAKNKTKFAAGNIINPFSNILGFGNIIGAAQSNDQLAARGQSAAASVIGRGYTPAGNVTAAGIAATQHRIATLRTSLRSGERKNYLDGRGHVIPGSYEIDPVTGDKRKRTEAQLKALLSGLKVEISERKALVHQIHAERSERDRERGVKVDADLRVGFRRDMRRSGASSAAASTVDRTISRISTMHKGGVTSTGLGTYNFLVNQAHGNKDVLHQAERLRQAVVARYKGLGKDIAIVHGRILDDSTSQWTKIADEIAAQADRGVKAASKSFQILDQQAFTKLRHMGYSVSQARSIFSAQRSLSDSSSSLSQQTQTESNRGHARGGRLKGKGLQDTVPLGAGGLGAPGELVVNRHTESKTNKMLGAFGTSLGRLVGQEHTPHSAPMFATGGRVNFGGHPGNVSAPVRHLIGFMEKRWPGLGVTSTTDHSRLSSSGGVSYHSSGRAVDMSGSPAYMNKVASWINNSGFYRRLTEGIHNPNLSIKGGKRVPNSFWGPLVWGQHLNHIHMALAGGLGGGLPGGAGGSVHLKAPLTSLRGVPGGLANAAILGLTSGLQRKINSRIGSTTTGGDRDGPSGAAPRGQVRSWLAKALHLTGHYSTDNLNSLYGRTMQESGGDPRAQNNWDCLPVATTDILTRRGWKHYSEVRVGDETLGFNHQTGRNQWTRVTDVHHYEDAPLVAFGNKRWEVECTPNHRWVVERRALVEETDACPLCEWPSGVRRRGASTQGGLRIHMAKTHGVRVPRPTGKRTEFAITADIVLSGCTGIVVAAPCDTGAGLPITVDEAELLGWVLGDGHVRDASRTTHRGRKLVTLSQKKSAGVDVCRALVATVDANHRTYEHGNGCLTWALSRDFGEALLDRAGYSNPEAMVLAMSVEQRDAFLRGVVGAEGTAHGEYVVIPQVYGEKFDAILLAVYLSGRRPSVCDRTHHDEPHGWSPSGVIGVCRPRVSPLQREDRPSAEVWCVSTELGSWTARQNGQVFLTGNSNARAGQASRGILQTIPSTFNTYKLRGHGNIWNPVDNASAAIRYMFSQYHHIVGPSGSGYAMGGRLPGFGGWFGSGGSMTARHPTMIGVGDRQPAGHSEKVTVERRGIGDRGGAAPSVVVNVNMGGVVMHGGNKHEVQAMADKVADVVAVKLTAALRGA